MNLFRLKDLLEFLIFLALANFRWHLNQSHSIKKGEDFVCKRNKKERTNKLYTRYESLKYVCKSIYKKQKKINSLFQFVVIEKVEGSDEKMYKTTNNIDETSMKKKKKLLSRF